MEIKIKNNLIIADIYELGEENIKYGMYIFIDLFWDLIKINRKNKKVILTKSNPIILCSALKKVFKLEVSIWVNV